MRLRTMPASLIIAFVVISSLMATSLGAAESPLKTDSGGTRAVRLADPPAYIAGVEPIGVEHLPDRWIVNDVAWDDSGNRAFVGYSVVALNIWTLIVQAWPEVFALALGLPLLWELRRTWRRRQVTGEPHCRRCNYQLTHRESSRCPECGLDLDRRAPMRGRSRGPRLALLFAALVAVGAGYDRCVHHVSRYGPWCDWFGWWSTGLDYISAYNGSIDWLERSSKIVARVDLIGVPPFDSEVDDEAGSTREDRTLYSDDDGELIDRVSVTPDGRRLLLLQLSTTALIDADSGAIIRQVEGMGDQTPSPGEESSPNAVALDAAGRTIFLLGARSGLRALDAASGRPVFRTDSMNGEPQQEHLGLGVSVSGDVSGGRGDSVRYFTIISRTGGSADASDVALYAWTERGPLRKLTEGEFSRSEINEVFWLPADRLSPAACARYNSSDAGRAELIGVLFIDKALSGISEWVLRENAPLTPFVQPGDITCQLNEDRTLPAVKEVQKSSGSDGGGGHEEHRFIQKYTVTHDGNLLFAASVSETSHQARIDIIDIPGKKRLPILLTAPGAQSDPALKGYSIVAWRKLSVSSDNRYLYAWAQAIRTADLERATTTVTSPALPLTPYPSQPGGPSLPPSLATPAAPGRQSPTGLTISAASSTGPGARRHEHAVLYIFDLRKIREAPSSIISARAPSEAPHPRR